MTRRLAPVGSGVGRYFNRWRLALVLFLLVYAALLLYYLDYALIRWDETQHLVGGLLLSRGHVQVYMQFSYYPPLFDLTTALTFNVMGPSVFSARLVALTFGILSVWAVFEYAYQLYGPKNALLSSILLASMPGFIVLCRMALIETMLIFFFSITLLLFYSWMRTGNEKLLLLSGVTLGLGFIAKYQIIVAGLVMLVSGLLMWRKQVQKRISKILLLAIIAAAIVLPWLFLAYQQIAPENVEGLLHTLQVSNDERLAYGRRFPLPIFYLIEMTCPYWDIHPISLPIYILALVGLGYWLWRRKDEDKFSLIWFLVVYGVFTFIPNKDWRYVIPVFPILAVAASDFILLIWNKLADGIEAHKTNKYRGFTRKVVAAVFVLLVASAVIYSVGNAYYWVKKDHFQVPVKEASQYVSKNSAQNETAAVLFTENYFNVDMVKFFLLTSEQGERELWDYPEKKPVDVYKPVFNETWLIGQCKTLDVKFLLLYEHGGMTYFQSDWKSYDVLDKMLNSGSFTLERTFGTYPHQIFVIRYLPSPENA
jgi:4-amino-4-deoxy-L-arabinose transferase-like glycosyltransferase